MTNTIGMSNASKASNGSRSFPDPSPVEELPASVTAKSGSYSKLEV